MTRPVSIEEIERWVEATTFHRGMGVADRGGVSRRFRSEDRIAGEVEAHRAVVRLTEPVRASCSCRSRSPWCLHATAVAVAWARDPETFPEGTLNQSRRKRERVPEALDALERTLSELADAGLGTVTAERIAQLRDLATRLRDGGWAQLSASVLELADRVGQEGAEATDRLIDLVSLVRSTREGKAPRSEEPVEVASVADLLRRYREWREDPSAPLGMPVRFRFADWVSPSGRLHLVDSDGALLPVECEELPLRKLGPWLTGSDSSMPVRVRFDGKTLVARPISGT